MRVEMAHTRGPVNTAIAESIIEWDSVLIWLATANIRIATGVMTTNVSTTGPPGILKGLGNLGSLILSAIKAANSRMIALE